MAFVTLNLGLTLTIPTVGTRNWGQTMLQTTWTKISQHAHTGSGDGNPIGTSGISDFAITRDKLKKNLGLYPYATPLAPAGGSQAIDFNNGSIQTLDLGSASGDVTVSLANPQAGAVYRLFVKQAAVPLDVIWPPEVKWPQGQKLILTQTDDAVDMVTLYYDGTSFYGEWQNDFT